VLADLETVIARAEEDRGLYQWCASQAGGGNDLRRLRALLVITEENLARLYRSREILLGGEKQTAETST
jgi:hypothetical protein